MKILLRIVASIVALAVVLTVLMILQFAFSGVITGLWRSGAFGTATLVAWALILTLGPVGAVQLWRLRRIGLLTTAFLCAIACAYYLLGALFVRRTGTPLTPIVEAVAFNAAILALLLSPSARRICS